MSDTERPIRITFLPADEIDRQLVKRGFRDGGVGHEPGDVFHSSLIGMRRPDGSKYTVLFINSDMPETIQRRAIESAYFGSEQPRSAKLAKRLEANTEPASSAIAPELSLSTILIPERKVISGTLVAAQSIPWATITDQLSADWSLAYKIPSAKWEEIIAGAFDVAGFDEVILTPRSGDHGRDVIAIRKGIGAIKIISSVKAYKPGNLVGYDDIRAILGVLSGERDASKAIVTTTSDFPPNVGRDPFIAPFMPTRLELMNGSALRDWLSSLSGK